MFSLIKSVFSSLSSFKIDPINEKDLQKKLHNLTEYLLNSQNPFETWMELQSQNNLHYTLEQIYLSACSEIQTQTSNKKYNEQQIALIYQFYTLLLKNCKDELLVCKIVSDSFVINLCKMHKLCAQFKQQLQPYRINLIKAYLGTINYQVVKYMVIQDQFKVFNQCVRLFQNRCGNIEQTTIANAVLNIVKKIDLFQFLFQSIWVENGLKKLLKLIIQNICSQIDESNDERLTENILFLVQIKQSTKKSQIKQKLQQFCGEQIIKILSLTQKLVISQQIFYLSQSYSLFHHYAKQKQFIQYILQNIMAIKDLIVSCIQNSLECQKIDNNLLYCVFILGKVSVSEQSNLSNRNLSDLSSEQIDGVHKTQYLILEILMQVIKFLIDSIQKLEQNHNILITIIKSVFLVVFKLKLAAQTNMGSKQFEKLSQIIEIKTLQYFLSYTKLVIIYINKNTLWTQLIRWYQRISNQVLQQILQLPQNIQIFKEQKHQIIMLGFEYLRNYRFMIVPQTKLDPKNLKQDKQYQLTFQSPGLYFQPGSILPDDASFSIVCNCLLNNNLQQIPVIVIQDKQCFLIGLKMEKQTKILINIKFKDIDNLIYGSTRNFEQKKEKGEPKHIRINLKGTQQINLQFMNPKETGNLFKDYLIRQKDLCRQKQLSFLHKWVKKYQNDTIQSLAILKQKYADKIDSIKNFD